MNQNNTDELYHHGILGMKWGVRRYQNKDGSLTPAGRKKAAKLKDKYLQVTGKKLVGRAVSTKGKTSNKTPEKENKKPSMKDLTNEQLKDATYRLNLENNYTRELNTYKSLHPEAVSRGKKFVEHSWNNVISPAATEAGKRVLSDWLQKAGKDLLGLNPAQQKDLDAELRKEVATLKLEKNKLELTRDIKAIKKKAEEQARKEQEEKARKEQEEKARKEQEEKEKEKNNK